MRAVVQRVSQAEVKIDGQVVAAVGPGILLISRDDFLEAVSLDTSLSKAGMWVNLCAWMRLQRGKEIFFNPFAIGITLNTKNHIVDAVDYEKLQSRWGENFLGGAEGVMIKDNFLESDDVKMSR